MVRTGGTPQGLTETSANGLVLQLSKIVPEAPALRRGFCVSGPPTPIDHRATRPTILAVRRQGPAHPFLGGNWAGSMTPANVPIQRW